MKRITLLFLSLCILTGVLGSQTTGALQTSIYNELVWAYNSDFFPGVIEKADLLQAQFPQSSFLIEANCKKGEAFFRIGQFENAITTFETLLPRVQDSKDLKLRTVYFLAQSYHQNGEYDKAVKQYFDCASLAKKNLDSPYYEQSLYKSAQVYFVQENYKSAKTNFEYVVSNGKKFSAEDYNESVQKLCICYNNLGQYKKTIALAEKLNQDSFPPEVYFTIIVYSADALKAVNQNREAYENYCKVMESGIPDLAIIALKKAYVLAGEKNIGVNPADIFSKTTKTFSNEPGLVREFWLRLGIDEYNNKNYKVAEQYLKNGIAVENKAVYQEAAILTLYLAKINVDGYKDFAAAESLLENNVLQLELDRYNVLNSWYSTLLCCKVNLSKWDEVPVVYKKITNPAPKEMYQLGTYYYNKKQYQEVVSLFAPVAEKDSNSNYDQLDSLYASSLLHLNQIAKACKIYKTLYSNKKLNAQGMLEYSKALFLQKDYRNSCTIALESNTAEGNYVAGLSLVNMQGWKSAESCFVSYIKQSKDFNPLAYFYKGYCEYCQEDYRNAYVSFVRFNADSKDSDYKYRKEAYELSAKAALQYGDYNQAILQTENLVKICMNDKEQQEAVIFLSDIYCDAKKCDKAIELLNPYVNAKNDFTVEALFKLAQVYEQKLDLASADKIYVKIYTDYPRSDFAQKAMYRSGEVFYSHEDYASAQIRLKNYIYKFSEGLYSDSALFFCGDCDLKLERFDECVMLNTTLLSKYPESSYVYSANKNLLAAYYEQEYFNKALEVAKVLVKQFPEQAASDGIGKKLIQLEKIVSGTDRSVAEKLNEYEKAGKYKTYAGRKLGFELVQLYSQDESTMTDAVALSKVLLANHKEDTKEDLQLAAMNAEFLADYYLSDSQEKLASENYIKAAEYYRGADKQDEAATCLYGAVVAFENINQTADAKEVLKLMQELYPDSKQTKAAARKIK